jgi:putative photosynthetic complex assembly protein
MHHDQAIDAKPFPKGPLYSAFALVGAVVLGVMAARLTPPPQAMVADTVVQQQLRFVDRNDGGINVLDASSGAVIGDVAPGTNGFLRSTVRGMARERIRRGVGPDVAFVLAEHRDGRITFDDPVTNRHVDLAAFGATNKQAFARFLRQSPSTASQSSTAMPASGAPQEAP